MIPDFTGAVPGSTENGNRQKFRVGYSSACDISAEKRKEVEE